jgi:two-component system, OmpR family, sensor histidine kinase KdpD
MTAPPGGAKHISMPAHRQYERVWPAARSIFFSVTAALVLVAALTLFLLIAAALIHVERVTIFFLVPILISATRWGTVPALASSLAGVASLAFFFYPPDLSFSIADPNDMVNLVVFVGVALLTSHLAGSLKSQAAELARREEETRNLYDLSRQLAVAHSASDI